MYKIALDSAGPATLTDNGIHLTSEGYRVSGHAFMPTYAAPDHYPPRSDAERALLAKIIEKNQLVFHQWRPQNETYLFLFRKHEQGNNAKDIPAFDPLIEKAEKEIQELKKALAK